MQTLKIVDARCDAERRIMFTWAVRVNKHSLLVRVQNQHLPNVCKWLVVNLRGLPVTWQVNVMKLCNSIFELSFPCSCSCSLFHKHTAIHSLPFTVLFCPWLQKLRLLFRLQLTPKRGAFDSFSMIPALQHDVTQWILIWSLCETIPPPLCHHVGI